MPKNNHHGPVEYNNFLRYDLRFQWIRILSCPEIKYRHVFCIFADHRSYFDKSFMEVKEKWAIVSTIPIEKPAIFV